MREILEELIEELEEQLGGFTEIRNLTEIGTGEVTNVEIEFSLSEYQLATRLYQLYLLRDKMDDIEREETKQYEQELKQFYETTAIAMSHAYSSTRPASNDKK